MEPEWGCQAGVSDPDWAEDKIRDVIKPISINTKWTRKHQHKFVWNLAGQGMKKAIGNKLEALGRQKVSPETVVGSGE